ncbi:MAG: bifunctional UDP-N-acetylglucosamine diphosphorylase/glucosamine-1-phosphate N-acetyltransferase GlmU [Rhodospirillaceae bacterium]|jgi:bifunctional UDP-N-acetylglucosamine pyrophosphorylase / glucosamine-1-phosphate N-acetyltransferase|nr:bifunctional UDP-N-acetylglucosamine diphosphorylase/glucosamine-1-phosphate N-acetyltransferase GlmU [Rhodospirillaceae bacterium]MBT4116856.1 bifunctional UDP-N-acetylglucosamine diphosphorylase/glucosamine-1-phosphate N-acetyltransferase GlmU [Rhodospirillaceae bacterium]MBT4671135.1 bifunctional UDP-N-acetylglucosamine diphosphorylase/glucosamine-1-phosphate N-acetyltransferase GlmU [Rhodospirillaceae bacterium]MBT4718148.1 bifunctional UDP-N-acetylglucosamine diphosphorylase/glucosamine-
MVSRPTAVIILAAGLGTRMKSDLPKVLHAVAGRPMLLHLMDTVAALAPERAAVVIGPGMDQVASAVAGHPLEASCVVQEERLGTGHAARQALPDLQGFEGDILILYGDSPLLTAATMDRLLAARAGDLDPGVVVLGFHADDPGAYGRLILGDGGNLDRIVEAADADSEELATGLCNSGVLAVDGARLADWVEAIGNINAKGEYYLTDLVGIAVAEGRECEVVEGDQAELLGVDSRAGLATAEAALQTRLRAAAMAGGATLADPDSVYFSYDTKLGRDVSIGPNVVFGPGVSVADHVEIRAFCHIDGAEIERGAIIGPFARLRPGAAIGPDVHIGNFVEIKNATLAAGAKANHLAYIGDASVGAGANIGAGTITCNYDGYLKSVTEIGAGAFIGSNTALVAPVRVGDGAVTGAGSVITRDVDAGALAVARGLQTEIPGWAAKQRAKQKPDQD